MGIQGYLTYKQTPPSRTLQQRYAEGPRSFLEGGAFSYQRRTPVYGGQAAGDPEKRQVFSLGQITESGKR